MPVKTRHLAPDLQEWENPQEEAGRFPKAFIVAFLLVVVASFLPWGTIDTHYTWQFMANLEHPGLCNQIISDADLSGIRNGAKINLTGSAWRSGLEIFGGFLPNWLLTAGAGFLFFFAVAHSLGWGTINPSIPQYLSFYGMIHVVASALGFLSQGSSGLGLMLTGLGYGIFIMAFLRWK